MTLLQVPSAVCRVSRACALWGAQDEPHIDDLRPFIARHNVCDSNATTGVTTLRMEIFAALQEKGAIQILTFLTITISKDIASSDPAESLFVRRNK